MCAIIEEDIGNICHVIGRPKNNASFCKDCGTTLSFENCRETSKGSGSLRKICLDCERKQNTSSRAAKRKTTATKAQVAIYKRFLTGKQRYLHDIRISTDPESLHEFVNRANMAVQSPRIIKFWIEQWTFFSDSKCKECGGKIRYCPGTSEKVCENCGLIDETPEYAYDSSSSSTENHREKPVSVGIIKDEEKTLLKEIRKEGVFYDDT